MTKPLALIVEDDDKLSMIFSQAVGMADFAVETATDGQQALDKLQAMQPALILLDLHLPGVSGDKILAYIRQDPRLAAARVILSTADPGMASALQDQCDLVLIKPVSFIQLRDLATRMRAALS